MKIYLDGILVVEGKEDASYLSNYIDSEIVVTNGYEISDATITYLKGKRIIVLTDPDEAGKRIREMLNALLPSAINVEVDIKKCNRRIKKGIAECDINEILTKLKPYESSKKDSESDIKLDDLYRLGLMDDKDLRKDVCKKLNLGECNFKTFYKRLLINNVKLDKLCEIIK